MKQKINVSDKAEVKAVVTSGTDGGYRKADRKRGQDF